MEIWWGIAGPTYVLGMFHVLTIISTVIILGPWHDSYFIAEQTKIWRD